MIHTNGKPTISSYGEYDPNPRVAAAAADENAKLAARELAKARKRARRRRKRWKV